MTRRFVDALCHLNAVALNRGMLTCDSSSWYQVRQERTGELSMFYAGASRVLITPPLGTTLAGYPGRPQGAQQVYDDIFIRALVFENEGRLYALLTGDLMAVDTAWVDELRQRASKTLGIPQSHLMFAASHTHSAIGGLLSFRDTVGKGVEAIFTDVEGGFDEVLYEYLLRQATSALAQAHSALRPCSVSVARGEVSGIATNRIHPERAVDPSCLVLQVTDADGQAVAVIFHYCCHPTTLGNQDLGISGDFPGVACRIVESSLGPGCVALFLNGALGDISTRFSRRNQTYAEVERFGRILGGAVLQALGDSCPIDRPSLAAAVESLTLRPKSSRWLGQVEDRAVGLLAEP